CARRSAEADVW
nr:immunoglobulin heavy chain junction region [Macaca mulatta]MOY19643.1 immunoglobulin heavy chain junction region [Macaca mulatta]